MLINIGSGDSLQAVQTAAVTSTAPTAKVDYIDGSGPRTSMVALNGVTAVTLLSGPVNAFRSVVSLSVYNGDTVSQIITVSHVIGSTTYPLCKVTLQASDVLIIDQNGIRVVDSSGQLRQANAATVPTTLTGSINLSVGASTAGAGTTTTDATVLPAGTAAFYDTTAADDTVGVRIHASDKVDGRAIDIGNSVSNKILKIYPPTGGTINGAAANAAFSTASGKGARLVCTSASLNTWRAM